mgnify:CR=1 FL=1
MKYSIHLNVYDGPLDLLCDMISKQKIDIKDISIIEITKQYLAYKYVRIYGLRSYK